MDCLLDVDIHPDFRNLKTGYFRITKTNGKLVPNSTAATGVTVSVLFYPSKTLEKDAGPLIQEGKKFAIVVRQDSGKKELVLEWLDILFKEKNNPHGALRSTVRRVRILPLISVLGMAMDNNAYVLRYDDQGDLVLEFSPSSDTERH